MTCNNEGMSSNEPDSQDPSDPNATPNAQRQLMLGTRGYETAVLVGAIGIAVLLAVGSFTAWASNNWGQLLATWCGVTSALIFSALLAADLFRQHLLTRRRLKQAIYLLVSLAFIAVLSIIIGFFL